ncbi:collagen alpha-1(I) chain-like [Aedes albopictus]|uniref:Uncharacterized protein n=1 Tax=Aedes albopictus TaxID=7160 RepID=A0ABM1XXT4_AEDAL
MTTNSSGFHRQCEICVTPNTVEHFLCTCPVYEALRQMHQVTDVPRSLANDKVNERQGRNRRYGPYPPAVGAPSNRKPAGDRHGRVDLGAGRTMEAAETEIQKLPGTVGTSDLSGSRDPSEPPVGPLGPSGFPGTQVTSRTTKRSSKPPRTTGGQSPTSTEPPNHQYPGPPGLAGTTSTLKVIQPGRGHLGPLGFPGTRVVSPTPSDPHQHAHNHDQPGRKSPHLGPPFPEPER